MKPPTVDEACERGLSAEKGIHTFSNGTAWDYWAERNCYECRHFDTESVGSCAFEGLAVIGMVSPELARMFGWTEHPEYADSWCQPKVCRFFRQRGDDDAPGDPAPEPDPRQLVLLADPTEDVSIITRAVPQPIEVPA